MRLRLRVLGRDGRVDSILAFFGVEALGNEAWSLTELIDWVSTTDLASADGILSMAHAMVRAGDDPNHSRVTACLEVGEDATLRSATTADRRIVETRQPVATTDHRLAVESAHRHPTSRPP